MKQRDVDDFFIYNDQFLKNVALDNVIFGYHDKELKVLLQRVYSLNKWTVTGGHIKKTESIEEAASRIAFLRTGLKDVFFQQFRSFGNPVRAQDEEFTVQRLEKAFGLTVPENSWLFEYFVTVGFYTLTEFSKVELKKSEYDEDSQWWPVSDLPLMMFDHKMIIAEALRALRMHIAFFPIGYELLPEKFTLPEIHALYSTILGRPLDERNFQKRILASGIVIKLNETRRIGPHRSPFLYQFCKEKYDEGLKSGVVLAF